MDWKTSNHMDGSEIRDSIGLQYFAEDGNRRDDRSQKSGRISKGNAGKSGENRAAAGVQYG